MIKTMRALFGEYWKGLENPRKENRVKIGDYYESLVMLCDNCFGVAFTPEISRHFDKEWYKNGYHFDRMFDRQVTSSDTIEVHPGKLIIHPRDEKTKLREFLNDDGLFALYINDKYMKFIDDIRNYFADLVYFKYDKKGMLSVHRENGDILAVCLEVKV